MSTVDVAIPCYRYGHFLRECVQSVLTQTDVDLRLLIIDDASPDQTAAVATELAAGDRRITFRRHTTNQGHIATFNEGLDWSSADYTLTLSADDLLTPGALGRAVQLMDLYPDVGLTFGYAIATHDPASHPCTAPPQFEYQIFSPDEWVAEFCSVGGNVVGHQTPTAVTRTSLQKKCGGFRKELPHAGDMEMWLRLGAHGPVGLVKVVQAFYRQHEANMHYLYPGVLDMQQRKAAFDVFFAEHGERLVEGGRLRALANRRLAEAALQQASQKFGSSAGGSGRDLLAFALALEPKLFSEHARGWRRLADACAELTGEPLSGWTS